MIAGSPRLVALPLLGLLAFTLACGSGVSDDGSWPGGQDPNGTDAAAPPSFDNGDGGGGGGVAGRCSADLRQVLAEDGSLLAACPEDQGCHEGRCIPACEAAALSKGSVGCDFYAPDPPFYGNGTAAPQNGPCFAVFLANTWSRPAQLGIERAGQSLDVSTAARIPRTVDGNTSYEPLPAEGLPANEVAILFLSHRPGVNNMSSLECPVPPVVLEDAAPSGTGRGQAFHVTTDTPLSAYDIVPYGGASSFLPSATLLFPSTAWGTNYVVVAPHAVGGGTLWTAIVGAEDGTTLTVSPRNSLPGGADVPAAPAEQTTTTTIGRGEIVQWAGGDPSGMAVQSDKPVGLFAGTTYLGVATATSGTGGQDSAHQQLPHVAALGSEYVAAGVVTRMASEAPESVLYRIAGMVDGTVLQWDPMPPGAPATLDGRQIVDFESNTPFVVRSQDEEHPLLLTQYMSGAVSPSRPGCGASQSSCNLGDEEWINLLPPVQFLQRYVFFTDPTYSTTNLVIVRSKPEGAAGFADVELSCLGPVQGFAPLGSDGRYEYAHVDLQRARVPVANCGTSRHEATSAQPFGVVVWGTDAFASYAYQAGGNIGSVNSVQVPVVVN